MEFIGALSAQVLAVAVLVLAFLLLFVCLYLVPGLMFRLKIGRLLTQLKALHKGNHDGLTEVFAGDNILNHLWQEYQDTLHKQTATNSFGIQEVVATRATVPAEVFFNAQALVDSRLRTEFFKHLPGIFTGLGIIGTFLGLLQGLQAFRITEDTQVVRRSLEALLHGVSHAFVISAVAISLAMIITLVEKWVTSGLYRKVEEMAFLLDSMFESGAGEEYLARLVRASEDSASQTKILKDALVADLKTVLSELTERQISANAAGNRQLGEQIVSSLQVGLHEPLDRISGAVKQIGGSQSDAIGRVLTDAIAGLTQRIQELFGGQVTGINQLQQQTIEALHAAVRTLEQMVSNVDSAGQRATDSMATKLTEALGAMEARQRVLNGQMTEFVGQIRSLVAESQSETSQKLQDTLSRLGGTVSGLVNALTEQAERAGLAHVERERLITEHTTHAVTSLGDHVETMLAKVTEVTRDIRTSVEVMRSVTTDTLDRMNSGTETLYLAASDFAKAGQGVTGVLVQTTNVADKLSQAAATVGNSARTLEAVVTDYKAAREILAAMLVELHGIVSSAKREASLTADVLARIESSADKLSLAQRHTESYLDGIGTVLADAHQEFSDNMGKTLGVANRQFFDQLSTATGLLREAIRELETTLSELGIRK